MAPLPSQYQSQKRFSAPVIFGCLCSLTFSSPVDRTCQDFDFLIPSSESTQSTRLENFHCSARKIMSSPSINGIVLYMYLLTGEIHQVIPLSRLVFRLIGSRIQAFTPRVFLTVFLLVGLHLRTINCSGTCTPVVVALFPRTRSSSHRPQTWNAGLGSLNMVPWDLP